MRIVDPVTGRILLEADRATGRARARGLRGSPPPSAGRGLAIRTHQIHSFGMRYAIDAVYVAADGTVLRVVHLLPRRLGPLVMRSQWVFEMAGGEAARVGFQRGQRVDVMP